MGELQELQDAQNSERISAATVKAVALSFACDEIGGTPTQDEIKRRTRICVGYCKLMREDLGWSITKICDQLPRLLFAELNGIGQEFIDGMHGKGWVVGEKRTPTGLILPS